MVIQKYKAISECAGLSLSFWYGSHGVPFAYFPSVSETRNPGKVANLCTHALLQRALLGPGPEGLHT
jgi:hypothetical protein